jgi:glycosyltransferase involved in cell wall biosynthesis
MRIALVAHGFPPSESTGVENHTAVLAAALCRAGHEVEVFVPRADAQLAERSQRREPPRGPAGFGVTWVNLTLAAQSPAEHLDRPGAAQAFDEFLERERPELVHFQHLRKLGVGLIEVAVRRGLPALYTAHDYDPVCHRTTLLRPDLTRCETLGSPEACARCDRAAAVLDGIGRLGDYQAGALREQLRRDEPARLELMLQEQAPAASLEERRALDERRARCFAMLDGVIAPTEFLAERLVEGGLDRGQIRIMACGIDADPLSALAPPKITARRDLRFGYAGGISKHKGVHLLLEAFSRMRAGARLAIFGDGSDRVYVDQAREEATSAGAAWMGGYGARDLARVFSSIDVLVVPSTWYENAPFVIREAFAARRPVIASRLGALAESVRDGVNGLLVEPDDPDDLARAMERLALDPGLVVRLIEGILPPRGIDDHARELCALYESLLAPKHKAPAPVPAHARAFTERARELDGLAQRELFGRAVRGVSKLRRGLGIGSDSDLEAWLQGALDSAAGVAERARDERREVEWLRSTVAARELAAAETERSLASEREARRNLESERAWLLDRLRDAERERDWSAETVGALERERDWLTETLGALERERDWLLAQVADLGAERDHHRRERADLDRAADRARAEAQWLRETGKLLEEERDWLRRTLSEVEAERTWLRGSLTQVTGAHDDYERTIAGLARELESIRTHETWLRGECAQLVREACAVSLPVAERDLPAPEEMAAGLAAARERCRELRRELSWRRSEMEAARGEGGALFRGLVERSKLGARMRGWDEPREDAGGS